MKMKCTWQASLQYAFAIAVVGLACQTSLAAKPEWDNVANACAMDMKCAKNSQSAHCGKLYCAAKQNNCSGGDYSSGVCKDIKELHDAAFCALVDKDCGAHLPTILELAGFEFVIEGSNVQVLIDLDTLEAEPQDVQDHLEKAREALDSELDERARSQNK